MLTDVAIALPRWPIVGRRSELEVFERALASGECSGLVIHGQAGVGKTRLANECAEQAAAHGHPTERVAGSRTTAQLPLGAVVALLAGGLGRPGPDGELYPAALFEQTRRALHERHRGRRLVTVADDVALLDAASLALLEYLAAQKTIFLVATVRTGEPVPDLVTGLWRDGRVERVDIHDLSRAHLDTLLHLALGGPIEAGAGREFWEVTRGNPLYVRELVLGALGSGALVERSGVWQLENPLPTTSRLIDLVEQRIGSLPAEARSVVELLALSEPVELSYLETVAPAGVLESLERAGLVTITFADGQVRLVHPLHGKVVRAAVPRSRARAILLAQADRLEAAGPTGASALRIAVWRLDAGGRPDPAVLVRGAHLARHAHDFRVVRRLIEAVPGEHLDAPGALLLGEALYELGAFDAADRVLARGQQLPTSEHVALRLAVTRAKNAQWGLCQPEAALALNAAARAVVTSQPLAEQLVADEASVLTFSGHPDRALAALEHIEGTNRRTRVVRAIAAAQAASTGHRTAEAWLLHDLMRTHGGDTSARLSELASICDSPLVSARARHAVATRARDAPELAGAASDFEALGATLLAAEATAAAAEAFSRAGDRRAATAALRRSSELAAACEGAATPGLFHAATVGATMAVPLSGREREIAMLAAAGIASKDIADRLFLSVRTVNNHLQHAYTKLGVSSRADLAQVMGSTS